MGQPGATKFGEKIAATLITLFIVAFLATGLKTCYQRTTATGPFRAELSGKVVSKLMQTHEDNEGSSLTPRLIIEEADGQKTRVSVSRAIWQEARVGQWFTRDKNGDRLANSEPAPPTNKPE
jgi:hypothetical protein